MSSRPYRPRMGTAAVVRLWPWKAATVTGVLVAGVWFAIAASGGEIRAITVASPVCLGLVAFFLIGGIAALGGSGGRGEATGEAGEARAWALRHPWAFAWWPALTTAVAVFCVRRALNLWNLDESLVSSLLDGLGRGAAVLVCVALTGIMARRG